LPSWPERRILTHSRYDWPAMNSSPHDMTTLRIANTIAEMQKVVAFVDRFGRDHALPGNIVNDLNLCLDEILNNSISYGYDDGARHFISISLSFDGSVVVAALKDDAKPFDPRLAASRPVSGDPQTRKRGGLGLRFVNSLMDEVDYVWADGYNFTKLKKRLNFPAGDRVEQAK
jgi:serine/threonine-protein kinase RsbW